MLRFCLYTTQALALTMELAGGMEGTREILFRSWIRLRVALCYCVACLSPVAWADAAVTDPGPYPAHDHALARAWFRQWWHQGYGLELGFTGDVAKGVAGDTSQAWKDMQLLRMNTLRRLAGLDPVSLDPEMNRKSQAAALLQAANHPQMQHNPPATWKHWSAEGAEGSRNSSLAIGDRAACPIYDLTCDHGIDSLAHRLSFLEPGLRKTGVGSAPTAAVDRGEFRFAQWVRDFVPTDLPAQKPFVLWPNAGWFPSANMPDVWSVSLPLGGTSPIDLYEAKVEVRRNGEPMVVQWQVDPAGRTLSFKVTGKGDEPVFGRAINYRVACEWVPGIGVTDLARGTDEFEVTISGILGSAFPGGVYRYTVHSFDHRIGRPKPDAQLLNLSARGYVASKDKPLIGGFSLRGSGTRTILIRASGPALTALNVPGVLADPHLEIADSAGKIVAQNDNWSGASLRAQSDAVGAFPWATGSLDAAVLLTVDGNSNYTAIVRDQNGRAGVTLLEIYDCEAGAPGGLMNISARATVGPNPLIAGFVVRGNEPMELLIRAAGRSLEKFGIKDGLFNPMFYVTRASVQMLANYEFDESWVSAEDVNHFSKLAGAFEMKKGHLEPAEVLSVAPGYSYTAVTKDEATNTQERGTVLVEIYVFP